MWLDTGGRLLDADQRASSRRVWWLIRQMWDKGLLYEGFKVVPYCGRCGTALSSHEVAQGYQDITEDSVYVRFPVVDRDFDLLVWTTTPWTLISNVAAAVGPRGRVRAGPPARRRARRRPRPGPGRGRPRPGRRERLGDRRGRRRRRPGRASTTSGPSTSCPSTRGLRNRVVAADFVTTERRVGHRPPGPRLR